MHARVSTSLCELSAATKVFELLIKASAKLHNQVNSSELIITACLQDSAKFEIKSELLTQFLATHT